MGARWSWAAVALVGLTIVATSVLRKAPLTRDAGQQVLRYDGYGYFVYLPAVLVYGDTEAYAFADSLRAEYAISADLYQVRETADGTGRIPIYNGGLALLWAPAYWAVHRLNQRFHWAAADGHSWPYRLVPLGASWLVAFLGLLVLRRFLRRYFSDGVVALTLLGIGLGTNYFYYVVEAPDMTHLYLFSGYALFLEQFARLNETGARARVVSAGLVAGLLCLIRSSEVVVFLLPAAYQLSAATFRRNVRRTAWIVLTALPVFALQLVFFRLTTGGWWHNGYAGLGFDWWEPHLWEGLVGFRRGWLVYTPLMGFALVGIAVAPRGWRLPLLLFTVANVYLLFSWHIWWYGNTFGSRPVVQSYAVLALPLGSFFHFLFHLRAGARWPMRLLVVLIVGGSIVLNLFQHWQYNRRILPLDFTNAAYYRAVFGATQLDRKQYALLDTGVARPRVEGLERIPTTAVEAAGLPTGVPARIEPDDPQFTNLLLQEVMPTEQSGLRWVRLTMIMDYAGGHSDKWRHPKLVTEVLRGGDQLDWQAVNLNQQLRDPAGGRDTVDYVLRVPPLLPGDRLKHYVWNTSADSLVVHTFAAVVYAE